MRDSSARALTPPSLSPSSSTLPSLTALAARFREHYAATGRAVPDYEGRLRCYFCFIGLDSLRFYARVGQRDHYNWARRRCIEVERDWEGGQRGIRY